MSEASGIVDLLLKLIQIPVDRRGRYFDSVIDPLYRDAESIATDYLSLMRELLQRLDSGAPLTETREWLLARREDYRPLRDRVRIALDQMPEDYRLSEEVDPFVRGVWGLLRGGLSITDTGHVPYVGYGRGEHTVLDLLARGWDDDSEGRKFLRYCADNQHFCIDSAWKDVSRGYFGYRNRLRLQ